MGAFCKISTLTLLTLSALFISTATVWAEGTDVGAKEHSMPLTNPARAVGKVLVVLVYDTHCKVWCTHVRPIIKELADEYGDRVHVEEVDSSPANSDVAMKQVKDLGVLSLYKDVESVPVLLICDIKRKSCKEINGPKDKAVYKAAIEKVLAKGQ